MKTTSRMEIKTGAVALALTMVANVTLAQYPPASHLATSWWQWALETPASENPLTDTTGQFAAVNQPNGSVWFLAGNVSGTTVHTITAPSGKALFFPIVNVFDAEDGIVVGGGRLFLIPGPVQVAQMFVSNVIATATGLSCEVDGNPLPINTANLEESTPFSVHLPADNILGVPAGVYYPAVDSGYYVLLPPVVRRATHHPLGGLDHVLLLVAGCNLQHNGSVVRTERKVYEATRSS
jgi:hypothetical protein